MKVNYNIFFGLILWATLGLFSLPVSAQHEESEAHSHSEGDDHAHQATDDHATHSGCFAHEEAKPFDPGAAALHHIGDANVYSIGPWSIPLPCILYAPETGWSFFSSGEFQVADAHGNGSKAVEGYVLVEGTVKRIVDQSFPEGEIDLLEGGGDIHHIFKNLETKIEGKDKPKEITYLCYKDHKYALDAKSTADGGLFGGGITSYYDFSITKNVVAMFFVCFFLGWMFISIAKTYKKRVGMAPTGKQNFIEVMFLFIQEEVAKPFLGKKWEKFLPLLMTIFFFILGLNLFGQIPFFGGSNVTGNIAVTLVLALVSFFVINLNGNKQYWEHVFWMPGVPGWVKIILTPVEALGVIIKPTTLTLRLFANITAGHMVMVIFVGLIFVFGKSGANPGLSYATAVGSTLLTMFMMAIELLVAFIQAFVFTILTASYIGAATEEAHH